MLDVTSVSFYDTYSSLYSFTSYTRSYSQITEDLIFAAEMSTKESSAPSLDFAAAWDKLDPIGSNWVIW